MNRRIVLLSHSVHGHRRAYIEQFSGLFRDSGLEVDVRSHWQQTLDEPDPVLFLMVEESLFGYAATGLWRSLWGRRTVGLLFRGGECVRGVSLRLRSKRLLLKVLKAFRNIQTLTITSFEVEPALAAVADGGIHDPQLWDLPESDHSSVTELSQLVQDTAAGRRILIALGLQNLSKGFEAFCRLWLEDPAVHRDWLFVSAGKTAPDVAETAALLSSSGGLVIDRFVSDEEMLSLYSAASVVWACYAPDYDQASGIFGRAYQLEKPVVVRAGSQIDIAASRLGQPAIRMEWARHSIASVLLSTPISQGPGRTPVDAVRQASLGALGKALGVCLT